MRILVTGGAGFIGSHVVDLFVKQGHDVHIADDLSSGSEENINLRATFHKVDIRSEDFFNLIQQIKPEVIDHLAAHINVGWSVLKPEHDADINIMGTLNLLKAAHEAKSVEHIIFASTGGAMYGNKQTPFVETMMPQPLSPYGISKRSAELYLYFYQEQYGITYTSLRYANVYGPRQNPHGEAGVIAIFFNKLSAGEKPIINGDGKQTRDYVYVGDVAMANAIALEKRQSGEFNIGTTIETDVNQIYQYVAESAGSQMQAHHGEPRPGEQKTSSLDYSKAQEVLGWNPTVDLRQGIKETAEFFLR